MEGRQGICLFFLERTEKERGGGEKKVVDVVPGV